MHVSFCTHLILHSGFSAYLLSTFVFFAHLFLLVKPSFHIFSISCNFFVHIFSSLRLTFPSFYLFSCTFLLSVKAFLLPMFPPLQGSHAHILPSFKLLCIFYSSILACFWPCFPYIKGFFFAYTSLIRDLLLVYSLHWNTSFPFSKALLHIFFVSLFCGNTFTLQGLFCICCHFMTVFSLHFFPFIQPFSHTISLHKGFFASTFQS